MAASEKLVQLIYETRHRPEDKQHEPFIERLETQLAGALARLEAEATNDPWIFGEHIFEADITAAIAWRFSQLQFPDRVPTGRYPRLAALSLRAEALPEFKACPVT